MTDPDAISASAAVEFRAERAENLFRRYVEQLHVAQASHDADDWIVAGSLFHRFANAAIGAGVPVRAYQNPYGDPP